VRVCAAELEGVLLIEPLVFTDERGHFREAWSRDRYAAAGLPSEFVQDNVSCSHRHVLRGLHYQWPSPQGKLVTVLRGEVFDVVVDIRYGSPTFGRWAGFTLSAENARQLWVPEGFAHGFLALTEDALFAYKCTAPYTPAAEGTVRWSDPALAIEWPTASPRLSAKDAAAPLLAEIAPERLPRYEVKT